MVCDVSHPLVEFVLTRIAEDEAVARAVMGRGVHDNRPEVKEWIGLANPNRMLVWSGVRRRLVELHANGITTSDGDAACQQCGPPAPCMTLRLLSTLYGDHPDFQEQWRPLTTSPR
ncbi:MAG: hypothetical protein JWO57_1605 [Pseudonocardiales bacterium]|nr:hypothetical protein [Pseudonocardiales bacterium]